MMIEFKLEEVLEEKNKSIYWLAVESGLGYPTVYYYCYSISINSGSIGRGEFPGGQYDLIAVG